MAKQRIINTRFWDDSYIVSLAPMEKLVFLYLLTNPLTNIAGVYELPLKRAAFDVGNPAGEAEAILGKFERDGKVVMASGWIGIVNFIRYQTLNPKVRQGIVAELNRAPKELVDRLSIDYQRLGIADEGLSHLNLNAKPNRLSERQLSTELSPAIEAGKRSILQKWRV